MIAGVPSPRFRCEKRGPRQWSQEVLVIEHNMDNEFVAVMLQMPIFNDCEKDWYNFVREAMVIVFPPTTVQI